MNREFKEKESNTSDEECPLFKEGYDKLDENLPYMLEKRETLPNPHLLVR